MFTPPFIPTKYCNLLCVLTSTMKVPSFGFCERSPSIKYVETALLTLTYAHSLPISHTMHKIFCVTHSKLMLPYTHTHPISYHLIVLGFVSTASHPSHTFFFTTKVLSILSTCPYYLRALSSIL